MGWFYSRWVHYIPPNSISKILQAFSLFGFGLLCVDWAWMGWIEKNLVELTSTFMIFVKKSSFKNSLTFLHINLSFQILFTGPNMCAWITHEGFLQAICLWKRSFVTFFCQRKSMNGKMQDTILSSLFSNLFFLELPKSILFYLSRILTFNFHFLFQRSRNLRENVISLQKYSAST